MATRIKLSDHQAKYADRGIDIEADNGETFHVPPPQLWPDAVAKLSTTDPVACATELLGSTQYDRFVAAGGSAALLLSVVSDEYEEDVPQ